MANSHDRLRRVAAHRSGRVRGDPAGAQPGYAVPDRFKIQYVEPAGGPDWWTRSSPSKNTWGPGNRRQPLLHVPPVGVPQPAGRPGRPRSRRPARPPSLHVRPASDDPARDLAIGRCNNPADHSAVRRGQARPAPQAAIGEDEIDAKVVKEVARDQYAAFSRTLQTTWHDRIAKDYQAYLAASGGDSSAAGLIALPATRPDDRPDHPAGHDLRRRVVRLVRLPGEARRRVPAEARRPAAGDEHR